MRTQALQILETATSQPIRKLLRGSFSGISILGNCAIGQGFLRSKHRLLNGSLLDPFYWRNDYIGMEQWSCFLRERVYHCDHALHWEHEEFARLWDRNLREQGFARAFLRQRANTPGPSSRQRNGYRAACSLHRPLAIGHAKEAQPNPDFRCWTRSAWKG